MRGMLVRTITLLLATASANLLAQNDGPTPKSITPKAVTQIGTVKSSELSEMSGFTRASYANNRLWTINDSANPSEIFAVDLTGQVIGKFAVEGAKNVDWEAISSFRTQDTSYLLIADIGDNGSERPFYTLYIVKEPTPEMSSGKVNVEWLIHFVYEDGPQDAEALAIDEPNQTIMIISKRKTPAAVFELPLQPANSVRAPAIAKRKTAISYLIRPTMGQFLFGPNKLRFSGQPTDLAISPDGSNALLLTYPHAYWIRRHENESWYAAFARLPVYIALPDKLTQAEAVTYSADGTAILLSTEGKSAPIYRIDLPVTNTEN